MFDGVEVSRGRSGAGSFSSSGHCATSLQVGEMPLNSFDTLRMSGSSYQAQDQDMGTGLEEDSGGCQREAVGFTRKGCAFYGGVL